MRISYWSADVCSSDLRPARRREGVACQDGYPGVALLAMNLDVGVAEGGHLGRRKVIARHLDLLQAHDVRLVKPAEALEVGHTLAPGVHVPGDDPARHAQSLRKRGEAARLDRKRGA